MRNLRLALLPALLMLAACGRDEPVAVPALPKDLATFTVAAGGALPGRGWDGVVEAVRRADLAAQTGGRVTQVLVDVNDRVRQGDVLLRITAQEQEAAANAARAQLRAAEASAAEAEQHYRRYAALASGQYVSKAQIDQARAARDSAAAARDAARAVVAQAAQQSAYTVVRAPFAGIVAAREVEPGETVAPGTPAAGVRIPAASIAQRGELAGVYVVQDGRLLLRQLRLGARSGDAVEVIAGLKAGEVVASDPVAATQAIAAQRKAAEANRD